MRFIAEAPDTSELQSVARTASTNAESIAEGVITPESEETPTESTKGDPSSVSETSTFVASEPSTSSTISTLPGDAKPKKAAEPSKKEEKESDANLVGKINNLVTSDLNNIVSAKDFLSLSQSLVYTILELLLI